LHVPQRSHDEAGDVEQYPGRNDCRARCPRLAGRSSASFQASSDTDESSCQTSRGIAEEKESKSGEEENREAPNQEGREEAGQTDQEARDSTSIKSERQESPAAAEEEEVATAKPAISSAGYLRDDWTAWSR